MRGPDRGPAGGGSVCGSSIRTVPPVANSRVLFYVQSSRDAVELIAAIVECGLERKRTEEVVVNIIIILMMRKDERLNDDKPRPRSPGVVLFCRRLPIRHMSTTRKENRGLAAKIHDHMKRTTPLWHMPTPLPEYHRWPASKYMGWTA